MSASGMAREGKIALHLARALGEACLKSER